MTKNTNNQMSELKNMKEEIFRNPFENGKKVHNLGQSIHANPFRNYEEYSNESMEWEDGWNSVV